MQGDGYDLIYVTVKIVDKNGRLVPRTHNPITFEVTGAARIVATDNGDQTSHASFQNNHIKAFNGMALVILKSKKNESGSITLTATSQGLKGATIKLTAD
ncbi:MAG: hypothetical protein LUD02_14190 [Tannerellaceae bacterium]|nr:hypothetical protein [Tannerellaceae bacterium]